MAGNCRIKHFHKISSLNATIQILNTSYARVYSKFYSYAQFSSGNLDLFVPSQFSYSSDATMILVSCLCIDLHVKCTIALFNLLETHYFSKKISNEKKTIRIVVKLTHPLLHYPYLPSRRIHTQYIDKYFHKDISLNFEQHSYKNIRKNRFRPTWQFFYTYVGGRFVQKIINSSKKPEWFVIRSRKKFAQVETNIQCQVTSS